MLETRFLSLMIVCAIASTGLSAATARAQTEGDAPAPAEPGEGGSGQADGPAGATASPEDVESTQQAREHFTRGLEFFQNRDFREAIREFELASRIVPSADLWFNIARAHEELSEYDRAIDHYQRYLRDRVDPPDRERIEQHIAGLQERAEAARLAMRSGPTDGELRVRGADEEATLRVDDQPEVALPVVAPLSLEAGRHTVEFRREGYIPLRAELDVERGMTTAAVATMRPQTQYRAIRGRRVVTWILAGLAGAAVATSVGLGARAASINNGGDYERARDWAAYSDYALGGGIALGVGAVVAYFIEGRAVGTETIGPEGAVTSVASR